MANAISVGIDLGTSTCEVAYWDSVARRIRNVSFGGEGGPIVPSAVWFDRERGRTVVGEQAYVMRVPKHREVVLNIKREMGRDYRFVLDGREYTPAEISGEILKYLKAEAERFTDGEVKQAVITVPAKFDTLAREHTEEAARIAGLETLMLLPEPVAALIGYESVAQDPEREYVAMVYDFGGGTFDCSVVHARGRQYRVLSKAGVHRLGGAQIDERIADQLIRPKVLHAGFDLASEEEWALKIRAKILEVAEAAKKSLSDESRRSVVAVLPHLVAPGRPPQTVRVEITQEDLQKTIADLLRVANEQMALALENAGISRAELDMVVLVGGSTRLPAIREAVRQFMGEKAFDGRDGGVRKVLADANPDLVVSRGAARVATSYDLRDERIELVDILLDTVYLRVPGSLTQFRPLFARGTEIEQAKRTLRLQWPRGDTVAVDLYEGEKDGAPGAKYVGTLKLGPASVPKGTPVELTIQYRTDRALPEVTARVRKTGTPIRATVEYEQHSVQASGSARLQVTPELDLVFCIDTTGSMVHGDHLEKLRHCCTRFVNALAESDLDLRLAAISFGDRAGGERETVYSFTPDPRLFITRVGSLNENDGGDERESALDALAVALRLPFREGETRHHIVLVTDAPPHRPEKGSLEQLVSQLAAHNIRVDVVGPFCQEYDTVVAGTGGRLYNIDDELDQLFADLEESIGHASSGTEGA